METNLDEKTVRTMLEETMSSLSKNEAEHEILTSLLRGLEGWLRLNGKPATTKAAQASLIEAPKTISFRQAVLKVLKDARGEPVHTNEVHKRAKELGAITHSKNPSGTTDLTLYSWMKVEERVQKVGPRLWRYLERKAAQ